MVAVIPGLSQFQLSKGFKKVFLCEWLSNNFRFYLIRQRRGLVVWSVVCLLTVFCVRPPRWVGQSSSLKRVDVWRRFWKWAACGVSFYLPSRRIIECESLRLQSEQHIVSFLHERVMMMEDDGGCCQTRIRRDVDGSWDVGLSCLLQSHRDD